MHMKAVQKKTSICLNIFELKMPARVSYLSNVP